MVKISIAALIYKSPEFADWVYQSLQEFTPKLQTGEAEFYFIANDPTDRLLKHLIAKKYPYYINRNYQYDQEELFQAGYGQPEYLNRVYRGWNQAILKAKGQMVVLVNSDMFFSPDWLENLIKYSDRDKIICSKLVERRHPKFGIFPGALHGEFGNSPKNFKKNEFLQFANKVRKTGLEYGGPFMPCLLYKDLAVLAGLYPEGNLAAKTFEKVSAYGDQVFFDELKKMGIEQFTALDSIVYHSKEGEMDDKKTERAGILIGKRPSILPYHQAGSVRVPLYFIPIKRHSELIKKITSGQPPRPEKSQTIEKIKLYIYFGLKRAGLLSITKRTLEIIRSPKKSS